MPTDTLTIWREVTGTGNTLLVSGSTTKTILGVAMQQGNTSSDTDLRCGTEVIARNYATNFSYVPLNKVCTSTINIQKTGNDNASLVVNYVPYDLSKKSTTTVATTTIITGDVTVQDNPTFSFQEGLFIMAVFLFIISYNVWGKLNFFKQNV